MLTPRRHHLARHRRWLTAIPVAALVATLVAVFGPNPPAVAAGGQVICFDNPLPRDVSECRLRAWAEQDGEGTLRVELTGGGDAVLERCPRLLGTAADGSAGPEWVSCESDTLGWYSPERDCYFNADHDFAQDKNPLDPDVRYVNGAEPGDEGTVYIAHCFIEHYTLDGGWMGSAFYFFPPGDAPGPTLDPTAELIAEALDSLELRGPAIGTAPPAGGAGLVRLPVWLWNDTDPENWGTRDAEASQSGITAQASATATEIVWDMGDGTQVTCDEGTAWRPGADTLHPPCGHTYYRASRHQEDGIYHITAVTTWEVEWSVDGPNAASGTLTLHPETTTELAIEEIQVLVGR